MSNLTSNINHLTSVNFQLVIPDYNNVNFFCQQVSIPGLNIGSANVSTPISNWQHVGDKYTFNPFTVSLIIDENMTNYIEIYTWMNNIITVKDVYSNTKQATVILFSSHNNPIRKFNFRDIFPTTIGDLQLDITQSDITYTTVDVTFAYSTFEIV